MGKSIPRLLWLSIAGLAMMTAWQLILLFDSLLLYPDVSASVHGETSRYIAIFRILLIGSVLAVILGVSSIAGLARGWKWGYVLTLVYAVLGIGYSFWEPTPSERVMIILIFVIVLVPVLICTRFFFRSQVPDSVNQEQEPQEA